MSALSTETHPDIERLQIERLRQMPTWRKMALMAEVALAGLRLEQVVPFTQALDLFIARPRDFDRAQLARRQLYLVSEDPEQRAYVASAEDIVLSKLKWYRLGGEVSDRQWHDVLGVLKVQGERLDRDYMRRMAAGLGVADLLTHSLEEAVWP